MLAMGVNIGAGCLGKRGVLGFFASKLAPTGFQSGTTVPHLSLCFCSLIPENRALVSARALPVGYSDAFWPGGK
ncbi:hypothetical protein CES87_27720 [Pseudomonas sp. ERMR1:02]|nr:hypothetical protein CES87_27720 [Pseudomonas sp. ERMR1:02]